MSHLKLFIILLLCFYVSSCEDSINEPKKTAMLDLVIYTNDSVLVTYDNRIIVNKKLTYSAVFGYSALFRINPAEVGVHKIGFTNFKYALSAEWRFYVEDTLSIYLSDYFKNEGRLRFTTIDHEWYGE